MKVKGGDTDTGNLSVCVFCFHRGSDRGGYESARTPATSSKHQKTKPEKTKMAASSFLPDYLPVVLFVLLNHLSLGRANAFTCIWPLALLAPGGEFKLCFFFWPQSPGRSQSPAALWLGTVIEKGQLASCGSGCELTGEIWSQGLPEEEGMLGGTANDARVLAAGKQGQGEETYHDRAIGGRG